MRLVNCFLAESFQYDEKYRGVKGNENQNKMQIRSATVNCEMGGMRRAKGEQAVPW